MSTIEKLQRSHPFSTIRVQVSPDENAHWLYMHADAAPGVRPCCRFEMLEEMWRYMSAMTLPAEQREPGRLRHFVLASDAQAYNLGGDLDLFMRLIRAGDREGLLAYARRCVEGVHHVHTGFGGDVHTVALIQGDALGGGLEMALACHTIVAEEGVGMGLPEVLFGLFPGMGAYSFLCKRVSPRQAEKMILGGEVYSSEEMYRLGVVDVLVPRGQGESAVQELIRQHQRAPHAHLAMNAVRQIGQPVTYEELLRITEVWVDTALALGEKSLRTMERIVRAQTRRSNAEAVA
ncbi:crotonase/enoyl-CoA hydratase family protein [Pseudoxanthomonas taiwanensis]|jgi:Enoyl-CoA hydratase/carnithine racemase|uniref:Enoyl-CoA hydratase n=1 Tax=Pseudoxanthomonas taiwanensis TaxID=176598 RepID=A0A921TFA1_9GAMM|nr:crotonase/enoyl-CoA hydratase family protein [Pseudoxanthomonas taiwanensis]KAF1687836.1 enoyl-CoA hydratase [Pseudoxanthomonas taiwanensis]MBO2466842.1 enoyl-CoA hydratase [Xanthomonadaceae bacterium]